MNQQENREIRISPDALIALVVAEAEDRELSAMPSLEEMNAAFHPSEEFQKKMDRLLKQAKRKQERKGAWRATKRLFVVATTVVTAFACILMPVQAVQEAVVSTVLNWRDQFVEILYSKEDDPNAVILLQNVELTYLPEGFTETPSNRTSNTSFWNEYQSENGEWLTVRILPILTIGGTAQKLLHTGTQRKRSGFGTGLGKHGLAAIPAQPARRAQT